MNRKKEKGNMRNMKQTAESDIFWDLEFKPNLKLPKKEGNIFVYEKKNTEK